MEKLGQWLRLRGGLIDQGSKNQLQQVDYRPDLDHNTMSFKERLETMRGQ